MAGSAPSLASPAPPSSRGEGDYAWFLTGLGAWTLAAGMQQVLFSWLVVGELREGPAWLGAAQMCQMLPSLLFLLVGGATADRLDRRRLLLALQVAAALAAGVMAVAVGAGRVGLTALIVYALAWGTLQAFAQPARDSLLADVAGGNVMRAVTGATLVQFAGQALGTCLAGVAAWVGNGPALGLQAALLLVGLAPVAKLPAPAPHARHARHRSTALRAIVAGLAEVGRLPGLRPIGLLVAANGLFYMGPYLVLCPLMVRDLYQGTIADLSLAMMSLTLGTIAGSGLLLLRGGVRHKGQAFLAALLGVAICLVVLAMRPPFAGFIALLFLWGLFHAVFLNTSRTLFQHAAPASHRARVLSVHSLGLLGMAPLSNLGAGLLAARVDPATGCALAGGAMIVLVTLAWIFSSARALE